MIFLTHHFLEKSCDSFPEKEAVVHAGRRYTYRQIEDRANLLANWLLEANLRSGDRVAILIRNSIEYIVSYFGVLKAGGVAVPLNTGLETREIDQMIIDSQSRVFMTEKYFVEKFGNFSERNETIAKMMVFVDSKADAGKWNMSVESFESLLKSGSTSRPNCPIVDQDLAALIYTSGSSGKPKGVALKHVNIVSNTMSIVSCLDLKNDERCLCILPFFYVFGKSLLNTHFAVAGTVILDNRFTFPNSVLKTLVEERATSLSGVPSTFSTLLYRSTMTRMSFPSLRYLAQAGGHMSDKVKRDLLACFPDKRIYIMYGTTEAAPRLSFLALQNFPEKIASIGKAIPNVMLRVFNEAGEEVKRGQTGEIVARGSNIMQGYWNDADATSKVLRGGWYWTGDLGYCDNEGYFYVTGRRRDLVKVGMYKVSPKEVEDVLCRYAGTLDAAVIGVPDEYTGESLIAYIVPEKKVTFSEESITTFCSRKLPYYKIPARIIFMECLPKNDVGKISKQKLLQEYISKQQN